MSENTTLAVSTAPKASDQLATFLGIEKGMMLDTLKAQCFKGKRPDEVSDAQLAAFVSTANALQVNPLLPGFLYAYPERNGGITPILGPDGVFKKLDEMVSLGKLRGYECEVKMGQDGKPESATAIIHRSGDAVAAKYTAYFSEWCVTSNPNWQARPRHMLWVRAIKQAARQVIHGLPMDSDEYEIHQMQNVTPAPEEPKVERPAPKPRAPKGAAAAKVVDTEVVIEQPKVVGIPKVVETPKAEAPKPAEVVAPPAEPVKEPEPVQEAPKPVEPPKKVESFADAAAATEAIVQRALLHDGETITVTASIDAFKVVTGTREGKPHLYVTADITSPELKGQVSQTDGGIENGQPKAVWQLEKAVKMKVRGRKFKSGALMNIVDSIWMAEGGDEI